MVGGNDYSCVDPLDKSHRHEKIEEGLEQYKHN
jgi:hypothetical protein